MTHQTIEIPEDVWEALQKAHKYLQPHLSGDSNALREDAKSAIANAIQLYVPDFEEWERTRQLKDTVRNLERAYKTGLVID